MEKRVQDYSKEILKIIRSNTSPAVMAARLQDYHENDLAEVIAVRSSIRFQKASWRRV